MAPVVRTLLACAVAALLLPAAALASPRVSIFYYPWYGTPARDGAYLHWGQGGHVPPLDLATSYYPVRGPYSSSDPTIVAAQMKEDRRELQTVGR